MEMVNTEAWKIDRGSGREKSYDNVLLYGKLYLFKTFFIYFSSALDCYR